ncbi:MAG: hypothetical protein AB1762_17455 [Gemmatimonadota bacterium]
MDPSTNNEHDGDVAPTLRAIREVRKIRYTDQEWDTIVERARSCGQPPARYVRAVSLGVVPRSSRAQASAAVVHELGRIGNTLAALRADVRSSGDGARSDTIEVALQELLAVVRRLV